MKIIMLKSMDKNPDIRTESGCLLEGIDPLKIKGCSEYKYTFFPNVKSEKSSLHMVVGIPGSGKTLTWRKSLEDHFKNMQLPYDLISLDDIRDEQPNYNQYNAVDPDIEESVIEEAKQKFIQCIKGRKNCIVDATNVTNESRKFFLENTLNRGGDVYVTVFNTHPEIAVHRDARRPDRSVGRSTILLKYNELMSDMGYPALLLEREEAHKNKLNFHVAIIDTVLSKLECSKMGKFNPISNTCDVFNVTQLPVSDYNKEIMEKWRL